ncbi:MAG: DUF262 domain-containing protein [Phycisphaerales bacterium JB038]
MYSAPPSDPIRLSLRLHDSTLRISTILDHIDSGHMALPEFQRGYVWNRDQVRGFMDSLYRGHPVGSFLVWMTRSDDAAVRGEHAPAPGVVKLLLDGQQRVTSLYGIVRGAPPPFFDGNEKAFLDLYFHLEDETFEFYGPVKMQQDARWISVTELMQKGVGEFFSRLHGTEGFAEHVPRYMERMNAITSIKDRPFHIEEITGSDKTVDVVVEIFNRVNSGGTKLLKGDLALAKICAEWPAARTEMQDRLDRWKQRGFDFRLDWLLRNINTAITGEAMFTALKDVDTARFRYGLQQAEAHIEHLLELIGSRLGLDHDRVLGGRYAFPLMVRYLEQKGGRFDDHEERDRLLYWYVHSLLWGRYAGSTESVLNQDLGVIEDLDGALERLLGQLRQQRGDLRLNPADFLGWSRGARFYPLLYLLTRVHGARDWETDIELRGHLLGRGSSLQIHHIFPKARLYKAGYTRPEVNALANFTFLTQATNLLVSDRDPAEYLPDFAQRNPGALESHWIPMDPELWRIERYGEFLDARRVLLADAGNAFLERLAHGTVPEVPAQAEQPAPAVVFDVAGSIDSDEELAELESIRVWVESRGLPPGDLEYELADPRTGEPLALLDLAWPEGLQEGLSHPVAILLDETSRTEEIANAMGFRFFTDRSDFEEYVRSDILGEPSAVIGHAVPAGADRGRGP